MRRLAISAALLLLLSGCAAAPGGPAGDEAAYDCGGVFVLERLLEEAAGPGTLSASGREAVRSPEAPEMGDDWIVLLDEPQRVELVRELAQTDRSTGDLRTHEVLVLEPLNGAWMPTNSSFCAMRFDLGGLGEAGVALDPAHPFDPASDELHLLVTEQACANGEPADGRVRTVFVDEQRSQVLLTVAVEPLGTASCPGNPPTEHVVRLEAPLGDRAVLDGSRYPALELEAWTPSF